MPEYSSTMPPRVEIEELILSAQSQVEKIARRLTRSSFRCEFEEFVSIGMLEVCRAASHLERCTTNPMAYVCKAAQYKMIDEYRRMRNQDTISLDAPLTPDSSFSLVDLLPDKPLVDHSSSSVKRARVVHASLSRLTEKQRDTTSQLYALEGCGRSSVAHLAQASGVSESAIDDRRYKALIAMRKDVELCEAVGVAVDPGASGVSQQKARTRRLGQLLKQHQVLAVAEVRP